MAADPNARTPLPVLRLAAPARAPGETMTGRIRVTVGGDPIDVEVTVPAGPTPLADLLPVFQGLTDAVVARGVARAERNGRTVSCRAGCGACCRQLVPVSESEARALAGLVDGLPEPRRSVVRERFAAGVRRLAEAGVLDRLTRTFTAAGEPVRELGLAYFGLGVPCPFLEDESCSIHPDRPLACREYLVTSPAENCKAPSRESIAMVELPGKPSAAVMAIDRAATPGGWVPLLLAPDWAAGRPPTTTPATGPAAVQAVFARLGGRAG